MTQLVQALGEKTRSVVERGVVLGVVVALVVGVGATLALDALERASARS
jgi:hypothetical protein